MCLLVISITQVTNAARLAWKTLLWFCITALIAVVIGMVLGVIVQPGSNQSIDTPTEPYSGTQGSWLAFLQSIVPVNFLCRSAMAACAPACPPPTMTTS